MSNLAKKIRKIANRPKNIVCIDVVDELAESTVVEFQNIFWHSSTPPNCKSKNLIFLENLDKNFLLSDISVIIVGEDGLKKLKSVNYVLETQSPDLVLMIGDFVSKKEDGYFKSLNYHIAIKEKKWQFWRKKIKL